MPFLSPTTSILPGYPGQIATVHNYPEARSSTNILLAFEVIPFGCFVMIDTSIDSATQVKRFDGSFPLVGIAFSPQNWVRTSLDSPLQYEVEDEVKYTQAMDIWVRVNPAVASLALGTQVLVNVTTAPGFVDSAGTAVAWFIDSLVTDIGNGEKIVRVAYRPALS